MNNLSWRITWYGMLGIKIAQLIDIVNIPRIVAGVVSAVLLVVGFLAPPKTLLLFPTPHSSVSGYSPTEKAVSKSDAASFTSTWKIDEDGHPTLLCALQSPTDFRYCGAAIVFHHDKQTEKIKRSPRDNSLLKSLDLTHYTGLEISINYKGTAKHVVTLFKNLNDHQVERRNLDKGKLHYSTIHPEEYDRSVHIPFEEFKVADWWLRNNNVHRKQSTPEFTHIAEIAFGLPENVEPGIHVLRVESVAAQGQWLSRESMYLGLLATWVLYALFELGRWIIKTRWRTQIIESSLNRANHDANTDALTGLLNRRAISALVEKDDSALPSWGMIILDVDHFKRINDSYGHKGGDLILIQLSKLMSDHTRAEDNIGRWGGEEFILLNKHIDKEQTQKLAEKLRRTIEETPFYTDKKKQSTTQVTISCGVTMREPFEEFEQALDRADKALYIAKNNGRNRVIDL